MVHQCWHTVLTQSADCLHHIGISVSCDDSLIFSDLACLLTTKHNFLRNLFCFTISHFMLIPTNKTFWFAHLCDLTPNLSASTNLSIFTNELRWLFWFGFASITFGLTIKCAISGTKSLRLPTQLYWQICRAAMTNVYFRFCLHCQTNHNYSSNHATSPTSGGRTSSLSAQLRITPTFALLP